MDDSISYVMVALIIVGITYGLVRQIQHIMTIQKANNKYLPLFSYYIAFGSLLGVLISYILNILVTMQIIQSNLIKSDNTALSCFLFLIVFIIVKMVIIPKSDGRHKLLK